MGIYDKRGYKHLNLQENVIWNTEQIIKLKEIIKGLNISYIEIDDTDLEGTGDLTPEQVNLLKNKTYVYVLLKRNDRNEEEEQPVLMFFDGEKYQEGNTIIKSMSAGGYARAISFDLDNAVWNYYESDEDLEALAQRVQELETNKLDKSEAESTYATQEQLEDLGRAKQDAIAYIDIDEPSGTLTGEQINILSASELNYIWYNNTFRLDFKYRNYQEGISIYSSRKENECAAVFVNLQTGTFIVYETTLEKQMTGGMNVSIDRQHGDSPIINVPETAVTVLETAPTSRYIDGGAKIVHLPSSTGVTEYEGYIYIYDED